MDFYSTRGGDIATASQAILRGLASDGGLYVPGVFPQLSLEKISGLCGKPYQVQAARILQDYLEDYSIQEIETAVNAAYSSDSWDCQEIAPVCDLEENIHVTELFHGPTLAFKDIALKLLPRLVTLAAAKNQEQREVSIIVATSGDTGKAALEGFKDVPGTSCSVFYPKYGVSKVQELQMNTTGGSNTHVIGINGNFDIAQTGVKQLFGDPDFHAALTRQNRMPSSANSINFGRLVPQIVYYFTSYGNLVARHLIRIGEKVNFVVPTGNFGDILAGYYAMRMGLPVGRLICASNRNNVLSDFFETGIYHTHREFFKTMSPSMDILISSNLERLLYEFAGKDGVLVSGWMKQLKENGSFTVDQPRMEEIRKIFWAGYADDGMTAEEIRRVYERCHYVMDPHTAVGSRVLQNYREKTGDEAPAVLLSTASPYKFSADVLSSLLGKEAAEGLDFFGCAEKLSSLSGVPVPRQVAELKTLPVRHNTACEPEDMKQTLLKVLQEG